MLRATAGLFGLVASVVLIPALAVQVPLRSTYPSTVPLAKEEWNLDKLPNPNATDHLVFETVHSLLQHWPNTRMRNGHNIVPGRIPKGTLLYHGTARNELPPGPEWVATDPEHSYLFCRGRFHDSEQGCWHLTLITTRSLKVVYFDGSSAAKLPYGTMDTQDLLVWGTTSNRDSYDREQRRIHDICEWGEDFGVDGFVRMEMDFEVMLCDFTSGVSMVSFEDLRGGRVPHPRKTNLDMFEVMNSGSWHNHFPGETRVQLDLAGLVSFYDTQLAPSLIDIRAGQERWDHRVLNISDEDFLAAKSRLEATLLRSEGLSSGIDWRTLVQVIVDRYAGRLELTRYLLNSSVTEPDEILDLAKKTQTQLRVMLTPYIIFSATPTDESDKSDLSWTIPIYKLCATTHTHSMDSDLDIMTGSEKLLLQAVRGTTREICRVVTRMWAAGVYAGIDSTLNTKDAVDVAEVTYLWNAWTNDLDRLMAWLDWNVWIKCKPSCGPEEMCYLPTWPVGFPVGPDSDRPQPERMASFDSRTMVTERFAEVSHIVNPGFKIDDWIRPQPRCVRRVEPYDIPLVRWRDN